MYSMTHRCADDQRLRWQRSAARPVMSDSLLLRPAGELVAPHWLLEVQPVRHHAGGDQHFGALAGQGLAHKNQAS
jgi:hypothetical protein